MNRDKHGIIGQIQHGGWVEGGDSLNWMGHYIALSEDPDWPISKYIYTFEVGDGEWVRHPYKNESGPSYSHFSNGVYDGNASRDQMTGAIMALSINRQYRALYRIIIAQLKRMIFFCNNTVQNGVDPWVNFKERPGFVHFVGCMLGLVKGRKFPDIIFLDVWSMIVRGFYPYSIILYPLLLVFDLHILINSVVVRLQKNDDIISHIAKCFVASKVMPTPLSWLANRVNSGDQLERKLRSYWCGWRDNCDFIPLYTKWMNKHIR